MLYATGLIQKIYTVDLRTQQTERLSSYITDISSKHVFSHFIMPHLS